jgi:hypothetical protein
MTDQPTHPTTVQATDPNPDAASGSATPGATAGSTPDAAPSAAPDPPTAQPGTPSFEERVEGFGRRAEAAGERFGREAQAAGERWSKDPAVAGAADTAARVWGLLVLAVGVWFLADVTLGMDMPAIAWRDVWPIALIVVGLAVVLRGVAGRRA